MSVFAKFVPKAYPYNYAATLLVGRIAGGTPSDPKVAEGWLRSKLGIDKDELIREAVAELMVERGISAEEATEEVSKRKHLNGFKRDDRGLYIEGRQIKAALKEAASVAANAGKIKGGRVWGETKKGLKGWFPEHVFVVEEKIYLGVTEATGISQRFVQGRFGSAIQYEEYVDEAKLEFTVTTDHKFTDEQWAMIWLTGEQQGVGACRSVGYGRYEVIRWEEI